MMARQKPRVADNARQEDEVQAPSLITPLHELGRPATDKDMKPITGTSAWRKLTHLQSAYQHERLGAKDSREALQRLDAGNFFTKMWDCAQKAGRDSTASFDTGRCMGSGLPITEAQRAAIRRLVAIEMRLGQRDRMIIRGVCAWGYSPAEAIKGLAKLGVDTRVTARLCEALDALADAIECTAKRGRKN